MLARYREPNLIKFFCERKKQILLQRYIFLIALSIFVNDENINGLKLLFQATTKEVVGEAVIKVETITPLGTWLAAIAVVFK